MCGWRSANSWFRTVGFCLSLNEHDRASNAVRASGVKRCVRREQIVSASLQFGTQKKILNSYVLFLRKRTERDELWARTVLLLF